MTTMTRHSVFAVLAAATGLVSAACHKAAVDTADTANPMSVHVATARLDTIRTSITLTGTVAPSPGADWTITAPESGRIVEMPKAEGDAVKAGDLLVRFEVPSLVAELLARESEVAQTTARLQAAESKATRLAGLFQRGIAAQRDSDEAQRELHEAQAAANQALSGKQTAELLAARVAINARFDGVIARRWHNPGDQVEAGAGDPVLRVIDPTRLEVVAAVPAAQLPLVGPGRVARMVNPIDASTIEGAVITVLPSLDAAATTSDVRVSMPTTVTLTVGTPVHVEILSDERTSVLVVPSAAIQHEGRDAYVMVAGTDGRAHRKPVMVGLVARERTQIMSGLTAGENVILPGPEPVPDGASITIQK